MVAAILGLIAEVLAHFAPPPRLTVSEWADRERRLSREASAEPGQWRTDRAPYQRAVMDAVNDPTIETTVFMKGAQVGATEILLNILGYHVAYDPCPILLIEPTVDPLARAVSKDRIAPMLRDTPALRGKVREGRAKDASNTVLHKTFPGGHITLAGANSPASLASRPIRLLLADEVDKYPPHLGTEGDPLELGIRRTATFWNRKIVIGSTPTIKGASRIEGWYGQSDQRRFFVPCPRCGHLHVLVWENVRWEGRDPSTAHLVCPDCQGRIEDRERPAMLAAGEWRATAEFRGIAGFHVWEAYSPWRSLTQIVANFLRAREQGVEALREWVNESLGETWEEHGDQAKPDVLLARRVSYPADVPAGACCLTVGVDTQDDRLEVLVVGWGPGEESWIVDYRTIAGDPSRPEPWRELDTLIMAPPYLHELGVRLPVLATAIDSAGHRTEYVYEYCRTRMHLNVIPTIGRDGVRPMISAPAERRYGKDERPVRLYTVGVDQAKALITTWLRMTEPGPGFVHLPLGHPFIAEEFVAQLLAEKLVTRYRHGVPYQVWIQTRPRNEALDCFVLALAALRSRNPNLVLLAGDLAAAATARRAAEEAAAAASLPGVSSSEPPPPLARRVARSSYLSRP